MSVPKFSTALLLIDVQQGFDHPSHWGTTLSNPEYSTNISSLLTKVRDLKKKHPDQYHVIHVRHFSTSPKSPLHASNPEGVRYYPFAQPEQGEFEFTKHVNSAFIGTQLQATLRDMNVNRLFIAGLTTDHCVSTTVRMAANLGVVNYGGYEGKVILVEDATATFGKGKFDAKTVHEVSVESLRGEFAEVVTTEEALDLLSKDQSASVGTIHANATVYSALESCPAASS